MRGCGSLPFEDSSFDTIVATYILCTTPDPALALSEIHRLLGPGGRYLFVEHVHAGEGTHLGRFRTSWSFRTVTSLPDAIRTGAPSNCSSAQSSSWSDLSVAASRERYQPYARGSSGRPNAPRPDRRLRSGSRTPGRITDVRSRARRRTLAFYRHPPPVKSRVHRTQGSRTMPAAGTERDETAR